MSEFRPTGGQTGRLEGKTVNEWGEGRKGGMGRN